MQDQTASLVRERDGQRLRAMAALLALTGVLVSGVLGYVWLQVYRVRVTYELEDLRGLRADVEEHNRRLRLELLSLKSLARVESVARRLGLVEPEPAQVRLAREYVPEDAAAAARRTAHVGPAGHARPGDGQGRIVTAPSGHP